MRGLDLSKFKKLHSDEHTTTMVHPDGHQIKIAHKKLKPEHAKQLAELKKFDNGGMVESSDNRYNREDPNLDRERDPNHITVDKPNYQTEATPNVRGIKAAESKYQVNNIKEIMHHLPKYADGGEVADMVVPLDQLQSTSMPGAAPAPQPGIQVPDMYKEDMPALQPPMQQPAVPQQQPSAQPMIANPSEAILKAQQEQEAGLRAEASAQSALGKQEASLAQQQAMQQQKMMNLFQQQSSQIQTEIKAAVQDYNNGHIDPNRFFTSKSDLGKVSTAIGLILGGIGAGLSGGSNVALDFLNKQIDRDIDAQKLEMGKKHNMIAALQQQFGNMKDATQAARLMYADLYTTKLQQAAAASKDPMAQARAQQAIGQIHAAMAPALSELAMRQAVFQGISGGHIAPEMAVPTLVPKEHQAKVYEQIKVAQDTARAHKDIMAAFDAAAKETRPMTGGTAGMRNLLPGETRSVKALHTLLGPTFQDVEGTVRQSAMDAVNNNVIPQLGDSDATVASKRASLEHYLSSKQAAPMAKSFGIDLMKFPGYHNPKVDFKPSR